MAGPSLDQLVAIPSLEPQPDSALPFDLFVRLPVSSRVILYRREGSPMDHAKIDKADPHRLNFFVERESYDRYLEYVAGEFLRLIAAPADRDRMRDVAGRVLGNTFQQETPAHAQELMRNLGDVVGRFVREMASDGLEPGRQKLFLKFSHLAREGTDFQRHPLHVASLTVMIALGLGISDQKTLIEIALAGLLHDVGLTQLPVSVIAEAHRYKDLGTVSKALLKLHPQGSVDLLFNRGIQVSQLMENMILQHHEEFNGMGYPHGISGEGLHPLAQVLRVADDLDDLIGRAKGGRIEPRIAGLFRTYEVDQAIEPGLRSRIRQLVLG